MAVVDIVNFEQLEAVERQLVLPEDERNILKALIGDKEVPGLSGYTIDNLRDYEHGDDVRLVHWGRSAGRTDGGLYIKELLDEQSKMFVFASDTPSDRLARTPGILSSRALGLVATHGLMKAAENQEAAILSAWSAGETTELDLTSGAGIRNARHAARQSIEAGLAMARQATDLVQARKAYEQEKTTYDTMSRRAQRRVEAPVSPGEAQQRPFAEVVKLAHARSRRFNEAAQFIIVSDFLGGVDQVTDAISETTADGFSAIAVQVTNPALFELPEVGRSIDVAGKSILVGSEAQRETFREKALERQQITERLLAEAGATHIELKTESDAWLQQLIKGLA